jgi:hypothetical protein
VWWLRHRSAPLVLILVCSFGVLAMLFYFFYSPTDGATQGKESACLEVFLVASACQVYSPSSLVSVSESVSPLKLRPLRSCK